MDFVPLSGLDTEAGPVLGALVDQNGGPLLLLDLQQGRVRPIRHGELRQQSQDERQRRPPDAYCVINAAGQPSQRDYPHPAMAALAVRPDSGHRIGARKPDGEVRALSAGEREQTIQYLHTVGLAERIPDGCK